MNFIDKIKNWGLNNLPLLFAILRNTIPIFKLKKLVVVSRYSDVQEVLSRPNIFGVTYTEKMQIITNGSNFFLGMNDTPNYTRDVSNMRLVVRRNDVDTIITPMIENFSNSIISASNGSMDIVQELTRVVPALFTEKYMGIPGPSQDEIIDWTSSMFQYLFYPDNSSEFNNNAIQAAQKTRDYLDKLIKDRKSYDEKNDDIIGRCLELQTSNTPGMSDIDIRNNLLGIIIGAIPTTSKSAALVIDYLLDHPERLANAQTAAKNDNTETIRKLVLECLRFNSFGAGIFRTALEPYTIAKGTFRSKKITKGSTVIALTQSAMLDGRKLNNPKAFSLNRPDYSYMHFGYGMHTCFGEHINMVQIPIIVKSLLKCSNLRRASGEQGVMKNIGQFPAHLNVQFDI
ncbi:hypothetical protein MNBD_GAMMA22-2496 [hydrothermal vent metagenome]|uniref:Cytochrome P450 hydroxylase n=1 Tax=hydrothermal vent metagenome TaxID=652676 RepID=A0A3B1AG09_9ZZZZ